MTSLLYHAYMLAGTIMLFAYIVIFEARLWWATPLPYAFFLTVCFLLTKAEARLTEKA